MNISRKIVHIYDLQMKNTIECAQCVLTRMKERPYVSNAICAIEMMCEKEKHKFTISISVQSIFRCTQ